MLGMLRVLGRQLPQEPQAGFRSPCPDISASQRDPNVFGIFQRQRRLKEFDGAIEIRAAAVGKTLAEVAVDLEVPGIGSRQPEVNRPRLIKLAFREKAIRHQAQFLRGGRRGRPLGERKLRRHPRPQNRYQQTSPAFHRVLPPTSRNALCTEVYPAFQRPFEEIESHFGQP